MSAGVSRGRASESARLRQLERPPRFAQDGDGPMILVAVIVLRPKFVCGRVEGHSIASYNKNRPIVQLDNVEFHAATRIPRVYPADVRRDIRALHGLIVQDVLYRTSSDYPDAPHLITKSPREVARLVTPPEGSADARKRHELFDAPVASLRRVKEPSTRRQ